MARIRAFVIAVLVALSALPAWAVTLDEAKAQGLVGEKPNGYLGVVEPPASGAVQALVESVNERRRAEYTEIATRNGITLDVVQKLAGKKAIEKTPAGEWVLLPDGKWVRK